MTPLPGFDGAAGPLRGDLVPSLLDERALVAYAEVVAMRSAAEGPFETGELLLRVHEPIRGLFEEGIELRAPFRRLATAEGRLRNGADAWNALTLEWGAALVVAWRWADTGPTERIALDAASDAPKAATDAALGLVAAARDAVELADACRTIAPPGAATPLPERRRLLERALASKEYLLRAAALALLGRGALPREEAAPLLARAFLEGSHGRSTRIDLGLKLADARLFLVSARADAANAAIVSALAAALVREPLRDDALLWAGQLRACLNQPFREAADRPSVAVQLVRAIREPSSDAVMAALGRLEASASEGEQELLRELAHRWRASLA